LKKRGIIDDATPLAKSPNEFPAIHVLVTSHNSRSRATKGRNLGWKPHRVPLMDTIDETVARYLEQNK
jgi:nucleoside-diphosphate-sugar epimerase